MEICPDFDGIRQIVNRWRSAGDAICLVPTLGNLHEGHLQLVQLARKHADRVIVSIFVNPLQFGKNEDYALYPRTLDGDIEKLSSVQADALFCPHDSEIYPNGVEDQTTVNVPTMSYILCGATRPGHFIGVATIVTKLFCIVRPDKAVFGVKDFQQLAVIKRMVEDLCLSVEIIEAPVARAEDGLALSSRNRYLSQAQRQLAPIVYRQLLSVQHAIGNGERRYLLLEERAKVELLEAGLRPDYFSVRCAKTLESATGSDRELVIVAAAYLGQTRLIDNVTISLN